MRSHAQLGMRDARQPEEDFLHSWAMISTTFWANSFCQSKDT